MSWFGRKSDPPKQQQAIRDDHSNVMEVTSDDEAVLVTNVDPEAPRKQQIQSLQSQIEEHQKKIAENDALHKKQIQVKDNLISDKEARLKDQELRSVQSRQELDRIKNNLKTKEEEVRSLEDRLSGLLQELQAKETLHGEAQKKLSTLKTELETQLKNVKKERDQALGEAAIVKEEAEQLKQAQIIKERKICDLERALGTSTEEIAKLKANLERLKGELSLAKSNHSKEIENIKQLYSKNSSQAQEQLMEHQKELTLRVELLQLESNDKTASIGRLEAERDTLRKTIDDHVSKQREIDQESKALRNQLVQERRTRENVTASYESAQCLLVAAQNKASDSDQSLKELQLRLHAALTQKEELEKRTRQLSGDKSNLEFVVKQAEEKENASRVEYQNLKNQISTLESLKEFEIESLRNQLRESERKRNEMERSVQELVGSLPTLAPKNTDEDSQSKSKSKMMERYPGRVAIKCIKGDNCPYIDLLKFKYAVPAEYTKSKFESFIRGKLVLEDSPIILRIQTKTGALIQFPDDATMNTIFSTYENNDGTVHIVYNAI